LKNSDLCKKSYLSDQKKFIAGASWLCHHKAFLKVSIGKTVHYYVRENFLLSAKFPFPHMDIKASKLLYIKDIFQNPVLPFSKKQLSEKIIRKNVFYGKGRTKEHETFFEIPCVFKGSSYKYLPSYIRLRLFG